MPECMNNLRYSSKSRVDYGILNAKLDEEVKFMKQKYRGICISHQSHYDVDSIQKYTNHGAYRYSIPTYIPYNRPLWDSQRSVVDESFSK